MKRGVIFDLDQTIVDSSRFESLRKSGRWSETYSKIPYFKLYDRMHDLFAYLTQEEIDICVVTNSPRSYCKKVIDCFQIPVKTFVCYHDVKFRKPHTEPILKAIEELNLKPNRNIVSIGDKVDDLVASREAGISTIGAIWGSSEIEQIKEFNPDYIALEPIDVIGILERHWNPK